MLSTSPDVTNLRKDSNDGRRCNKLVFQCQSQITFWQTTTVCNLKLFSFLTQWEVGWIECKCERETIYALGGDLPFAHLDWRSPLPCRKSKWVRCNSWKYGTFVPLIVTGLELAPSAFHMWFLALLHSCNWLFKLKRSHLDHFSERGLQRGKRFSNAHAPFPSPFTKRCVLASRMIEFVWSMRRKRRRRMVWSFSRNFEEW